jgi:hypothetical protein
MRYGAVRLCPTRGGRVAKIGAAPAGCQVVDLGVGICAVAEAGPNCTTWAAMQAALQVEVTWTLPANAATQSSNLIAAEAATLMTGGLPIVAENIGNVAKAQAGAAHVLTLTYALPYLPHTTLEPPNCTANVTSTSCEIWAPTQAPAAAQGVAASLTGLPLSAVTVNCVQMGGGLGRKLEQDFVTYAVQASKVLRAPVQVVFPRAQADGFVPGNGRAVEDRKHCELGFQECVAEHSGPAQADRGWAAGYPGERGGGGLVLPVSEPQDGVGAASGDDPGGVLAVGGARDQCVCRGVRAG